MKVSLIAAVAENRTIGRAGDLPWRLRDDTRWFMQKTMGHHVIMGRKNYESMGKPLPGRHNVVISRNAAFAAACPIVSSLTESLSLAERAGEGEAFIIGGAEIYALALPFADTYYRTRVLATVPGDTFFPVIDESEWSATVLAEHAADARNEHAFVIEELSRVRGQAAWRSAQRPEP
jgi:dihydrofolate reductase